MIPQTQEALELSSVLESKSPFVLPLHVRHSLRE